MPISKHLIAAALAAALAAAHGTALAQAAGHAGHQMNAPAQPAASPSAPAQPAAAPAAMDHGDMQMQGGSAPPDARDPHAYSGGYTLTTGPYIASERLRLGDEKVFSMLLVDRLEAYRSAGQTVGSYELQARIGRDYKRFVLKAEGDVTGGRLEESQTEALWSRAFATFWDAQVGLRHDTGEGRNRTWAAFGVQGLAPYWFEVDATFYVGPSGRTALGLAAEYELLLTQKLILQPRVEADLYGRDDAGNGIGKGLSSVTAGVRLRYEFAREFAPYIGVEWSGQFGRTADFARTEGRDVRDARIVAGVRFWF